MRQFLEFPSSDLLHAVGLGTLYPKLLLIVHGLEKMGGYTIMKISLHGLSDFFEALTG